MATKSIHDFEVKNLHGKPVSLSDYKGKVCLVVNTASECGLTPQLAKLQELQEEFAAEDFTVLGFPSNDFQGQEPLEGEQIKDFCELNYGVDFPMFDKVTVKGDEAVDLYKFLSEKEKNGNIGSKPKWNFHKYLVNKEGEVVDYFWPTTSPTSTRVKKAIKKLLS